MANQENAEPPLFGIEEEGLYNRCLFSQISLNELENELKKRNIVFNSSDSCKMLTTKLKLHILNSSKVQPSVVKQLERELEEFSSDKSKNEKHKHYKCSLPGCNHVAKHHVKYVKHLQLHESLPFKILCQLKGCQRELSNVAMLRTHISTCHRTPRTSSVLLKQSQLVEELVNLRCLQTECDHQLVGSLADLKRHLKSHTDKREMVQCPFADCSYETYVSGSFTSHLSRIHPIQQVHGLKVTIVEDASSQVIKEVDEGGGNLILESVNDDYDDNYVDDIESDEYEGRSDDEDDKDDKDDEIDEETFLKSLSIVFNNWMNVAGIPYSTVNLIVAEVFKSYSMGADLTKNRIRKILLRQGLDEIQVQNIIESAGEDDPFKAAKEQLESEKKRLTFIKEAFKNTPPETIRLNPAHESKVESYEYVSLKGSIKNLLEDESYQAQKKTDPYRSEEGLVKDVRDGQYFKHNKYFQDNPDAVPILLFQDELELCNPLGSGKSKHKVNATYFTTLDIQSPLRSRVKSIQLVSLVMSKVWKKYGNEKCNERLIKDLMELESDGIEVNDPEKKVAKAALCYIVGDNLGLHQLAEFSANFNSGHICRVCEAKYEDVCRKHLLYAGREEGYYPPKFSVDSYNEFAQLAETNETHSPDTRGIKGTCCFNKLQSYHCATGMPPCLGHDWFEGAFAYDVQHLLDYIILKEKLVSVDEFNRKLRNFQLNQRDAKNRPNIFKGRKVNSKYEGSAGQLRVLSRMITILLSDILDESRAGKMLVKLAELSEIITSPKLSNFEIEEIMPELIYEYLEFRVNAVEDLNMPNPRPKHHMISHYHEAYLMYGPLISLWGMRMESKHVYFKTVIKASKNFRNVAKTCARRHQMAQISYAYAGLFPRTKHEIPDDAVHAESMKSQTSDKFLQRYLNSLNSKSLILKKVKVFGTLYSPGNILILKKELPGTLEVGLLRTISFYEEQVNFGIETFLVQLNKFNIFVTVEKLSEFQKVDYKNLHDYYPLQRHGTMDSFSFSLHHFISES